MRAGRAHEKIGRLLASAAPFGTLWIVVAIAFAIAFTALTARVAPADPTDPWSGETIQREQRARLGIDRIDPWTGRTIAAGARGEQLSIDGVDPWSEDL